MDTSTLLRIHAALDDVSALGPGPAAVLWVQGCLRGCRGCMSPDTFDPSAGQLARVSDVAAWLEGTGRCHLTLSGGEPFDQASGLVQLIDRVRADRDWTVTCYTGHRLEDLERNCDASTAAMLDRLDLLIDGPYIAAQHAPLRWRGSSNQRVHALSGRIRPPDDLTVGVEVHFDLDGHFRFVGVPPVRQFVETFVQLGASSIAPAPPSPSLPFPIAEGS